MTNRPRKIRLDLPSAGAAHPGITPALWAAWTEAAVVTLERFHGAPPPPTPCTITYAGRLVPATLAWSKATVQMRNAHANELDAIRDGAYAVVSATVGAVEGWRIVKRALHASGADLVMLPADDDEDQSLVKLEVSGIAKGVGAQGHTNLRGRLRDKVRQLGRGKPKGPGIAGVFGFQLASVLVSELKR